MQLQTFYDYYKFNFINLFSPLLKLDDSKTKLLLLVNSLEDHINSSDLTTFDFSFFHSFLVKTINDILFVQDAQIYLEFHLKFYYHFHEIMRLYSLLHSPNKPKNFTFRFRLYLKLLADLNFVCDNYSISSNLPYPKWIFFYKGYISMWLVNQLTVSYLTRDKIVTELYDVLSKEITLLDTFYKKNNLNLSDLDTSAFSSDFTHSSHLPVSPLSGVSIFDTLLDKNILADIIGRLIKQSSILTTNTIPYNNTFTTVISIDESFVHQIVEGDNIMLGSKLLPMFIKPKPWLTSFNNSYLFNFDGGYITNNVYHTESIVKNKWSCTLLGSIGTLDIHCLNILQSFSYHVNKDFYYSMKKMYVTPNIDVSNIISLIDSIILKISYYDSIYFPWSCDFRYRKYAIGGLLSFTNSKLPRYILSFNYQYTLNDISLQIIRNQLIRKNINKLATDADCLKYSDTKLRELCIIGEGDFYNVENHKLFYLMDCYNNNPKKLVGDILWLDHICSGFMLLTILFKDTHCARLLNLTDNNQIYDFYSSIVDQVIILANADRDRNGSQLIHPFKNYYIIKSNTDNLNNDLKNSYNKVLMTLISSITNKTLLKDVREIIDNIIYPIIEITSSCGTRYYYTYVNKIVVTKKSINDYFKTKNFKKILDIDKLKIVRIYTISDITEYIISIEDKRSVLKKLIMCIPYLITQTTGIKNIKKELNSNKDKLIGTSLKIEESDILNNIILDINNTVSSKSNKFNKSHNNISTPASYYLYNLTIIALKNVAPNVIGGMDTLSKYLKLRIKNKVEYMNWNNLVGSTIKYKYHCVDSKTYFYGPSVNMGMVVREPIKNKINYKQHYTSSIAHFIHSLDASLITMVVTKWSEKYPEIPITTIHDCYGIPYTHANELRELVLSCLKEIINKDPLNKYLNDMNFTDLEKTKINQWVGSLNNTDLNNAKYFLN